MPQPVLPLSGLAGSGQLYGARGRATGMTAGPCGAAAESNGPSLKLLCVRATQLTLAIATYAERCFRGAGAQWRSCLAQCAQGALH